MRNEKRLFEISAEMLLNYLYPESIGKWQVDSEGTFYRNYNMDVLSVDEEQRIVRLARDGFLRLLPQGLLSSVNELKGDDFEQKYIDLKRKRQLLHDLFKPIDTYVFQVQQRMEKEVSALLEERLEWLLRDYFGYDLSAETSPYVKEVAPLLLFVGRLRADFGFLRDLLKQLLGFEVRMRIGRYTWDEKQVCSQPMVCYEVIVPGLTTAEVNELDRDLKPLCDFINEWFVPYDTYCAIRLKDAVGSLVLEHPLTLDYNTEIE